MVAYRGISSSWKLPPVPPYGSRQILANIEKIEKIFKNISQYLNNQKAFLFINVSSAHHYQTSGVSFFSQHLALSTLSCLLPSHSYSFFIAGQYYLTRFRLNLNTPFIWKTPTPSMKNWKYKQCSFHRWWHIKMYPKGKSSRKKSNIKLQSQKRMPFCFQLRFYARRNVAKRRKVCLLAGGSVAKKIFTSAMVKLGREIADLNIVMEDVKWGRVQCSSRTAKYDESEWNVRAGAGRDELK